MKITFEIDLNNINETEALLSLMRQLTDNLKMQELEDNVSRVTKGGKC